MLQYIYFVKCPNCEDEPFDFFDEAKQFALGCLSKKPIITQIEVDRNDFGECTDSCDLGTVWSWEDIMKETDAEPTISIFTKDDLKKYCPDCDPEFDNSLDVEIEEVSEDFTGEDLEEWINISSQGPYVIKVKNNADGYNYEGNGGRSLVRIDSDELSIFNSYDAAMKAKMGYKNPKSVEITLLADEQKLSECRKPIPKGMTIEQLVEEMEENEDTVECTWCNDLFDKDQCRKEVNLGYLCSRCEAAIKSRGEKLTFEENNYWDFLNESLEDLTLADMVSDSIRHLVNDLGKNPNAEDFTDLVILDIEKHSDDVPEDPVVYSRWASEIACEVSRQLNNSGELNESASDSSSTKPFDPKEKVELEYKNIEVTVELGRDQGWNDYSGGWDEPIEKDLSGDFTYEVDALEVASVIWEEFLDDDLIMSLPGGPEAMECDYHTDEASLKFWGLHFEDLVKKYYDKLLEFFREDALEAAREEFANDYLED